MSRTIPTSVHTGVAITNPLILYRALLATKRIYPDPQQHRLALELQKLYLRLKDYSPRDEYGARITAIGRDLKPVSDQHDAREVAVPGHPLRRNPLFSRLFSKNDEYKTLALTRVLTSHEAAMELDSPKGFLLHGEVGTGKSMFLDLLADSLPNRKKRRWHFNTFMLETMAQLEHLRKSRSQSISQDGSSEHSLILLARDLIEKSPILFLDEFQLPDRAASKILSNLFTVFFQLGGVLIASSNRMPDELAKASGVDYTVPSGGVLVRNFLGFGTKRSLGMFPANNEYAGFVELLKTRCEIYNLSGRDWRRREAEELDQEDPDLSEIVRQEIIEGLSGPDRMEPGIERSVLDSAAESSLAEQRENISKSSSTSKVVVPKKYFLNTSSEEAWEQAVHAALPPDTPSSIPWQSTTLRVYGRTIPVPCSLNGVTRWSFLDLCAGMYGPADYITLASTFHTLILDDVPVLTVLQKNEARRMITLLDALYEARCKLIMRAEAGPDDIFFPETKATAKSAGTGRGKPGEGNQVETDGGDAVYPETLSEIYQDQTSPFRPNVSIYTDAASRGAGYDPDEDSDFGPIPGTGNEIGRTVDFGMTSSFTGEDERFAYKRAGSRLWELCSASWHSRSEPGWWSPVPLEVRRWERTSTTTTTPTPARGELVAPIPSDVKIGPSVELDKPAGLQGRDFDAEARLQNKPPPSQGSI